VSARSSTYTAPELDKAALITIDVQSDVLDGQALEIPGSSAALPAMGRLVEAFRERGLPIVHIVRLYRTDGSNVDLCRREAVMNGWKALAPDSPGSALAAGLLGERGAELDAELLLRGEAQGIGENEVVMYKPRWGAFFQTPLHEHLTGLGVSTVVFCGVNFPNCPRTSMYEASERDLRIVLASDAISGLYERGREELANIGVALMTAGDLLAALAPAPAVPARGR
jgi:nicotinamidase-related amidase